MPASAPTDCRSTRASCRSCSRQRSQSAVCSRSRWKDMARDQRAIGRRETERIAASERRIRIEAGAGDPSNATGNADSAAHREHTSKRIENGTARFGCSVRLIVCQLCRSAPLCSAVMAQWSDTTAPAAGRKVDSTIHAREKRGTHAAAGPKNENGRGVSNRDGGQRISMDEHPGTTT